MEDNVEGLDESNDTNENQSENEVEQENDTNDASEMDEKTLAKLVDHLKESGFNIGDKTEKAPDMIGAVEGFGIELDGGMWNFINSKQILRHWRK